MTAYTSEWYADLKGPRNNGGKHGPKVNRSHETAIRFLVTAARDIRSRIESGNSRTEDLVHQLRGRLQEAVFFDFVTPELLKASKVLDQNGLDMIFQAPEGIFPLDIVEDTAMLFAKWMIGDLDPHLLRGINVINKRNKELKKTMLHRTLVPGYPFRLSCDCLGDDHLINGQWWPLLICARRDGAHGEIEAGIHGSSALGAHSILISGSSYDDIDRGEELHYCGTPGKDGKPSTRTGYMIKSCENHTPVRVLRTHNLPQNNPYRPAVGLRYDGLYRITDFTVRKPETVTHRFTLKRLPGQNPIRNAGPGARPTAKEQDMYRDLRLVQALEI